MRYFLLIMIMFSYSNLTSGNLQVSINSGITQYKNDRYGNSLEVGIEYYMFNSVSFGISYEKFESAYYLFEHTNLAEELNFVINTSYALPKLVFNYYPLDLIRHKVRIGSYFTRGRLTSDRPSYFDLIEIYKSNTEQNIVNVDYGIGDYIKQVNGIGFTLGYSYFILPDKMNIGFLFDYIHFYPTFNTSYYSVPWPISIKLSFGFIL